MSTVPANHDPLSAIRASTRPAPRARKPDPFALLDLLPTGVLCLDRNLRFTYANPAAYRISRITPDKLNGPTLQEAYPDMVGSDLEAACLRVIATGNTEQMEHHSVLLDKWYDMFIHAYDDGPVIFYHEITARKLSEQARDAVTRRLEQVFDSISEGVFLLDREWRMTFLNRQLIAMHHHRTDLLGKNLWEMFPNAVGSLSWVNYHRTMHERVPIVFETFSPVLVGRYVEIECRPSDDGIVVFIKDITDHRQAEQVMAEQQTLLATVQQNARLATWDHDLASGSIRFKAGSYPVYGHPLEQIVDVEAFRRILHPDDRLTLKQDFAKAVGSGKPFVVDFRVVGADGEVIWIESRGHASYCDGIPTHLHGIALDVTDRKRGEQALAASEQRYRILADLNPQALWAGEADGTITYANQFYLDYIRLSSDDLPDWLECFDPDDRERVGAAWTHSVQTGEVYDIEARLLRGADGASRWWQIRASPVRDDTGKILSWLGVSTDIHDARTAAEALRRQQQETERKRAELETVYRTTPVGLALFDPVDFRFLHVNERGAEILGYTEKELVGRKLSEVSSIPGLFDIFHQVANGMAFKDLIVEGEVPARPGDRRIWNVNYFPVYGPTGSVDAIATASLDITHQKKAEAALVQSEKLAAVGRLASSISHEINNPLEAVTNLLYIIATAPSLPPDLSGFVMSAQAELARVSQIATQTLRFHRQAVARTVVSAADLVGAVITLYHGRLANSGIQVDQRYDTDCNILCFENDIRQVLNNLIANAIDAMRRGGRLLARAHLTHDAAGVQGVRITVADTGHGMSAATRARIFEPFYTTKDLNGTGLGLWISAGIVERHGGRLTVHSSTNPAAHGTVFTLFLPCEAPLSS